MTRPATPPILSELRNASSPASQIRALRDLKNEIIGHDEKKEQWVGLGVVTPLARILNSHRKNGKKKSREVNGAGHLTRSRTMRTEEEDARLQAVIIVGSLAFGGPAFLAPLYAGLVVSPLLSLLSPGESHPLVITQALKTLNTIADSSRLSAPHHGNHDAGLSNLLYTQQHVSSVVEVLSQPPVSPMIRQQIDLTASLICKTCCSEQHRASLAQYKFIEALATAIGPLIIDTCPSPNDDYQLNSSYAAYQSTQPRLPILLKAIGLTIKGSRSRAVQFISAPPLASAFRKIEAGMEAQYSASPNSDLYAAANGRQNALKAFESLMPLLPTTHARSNLAGHSSGGNSAHARSNQASQSLSTAIEVIQSQGLEYVGEDGSPFIPWLLFAFRSQDEATSPAAAELLVTFHRLGMIKRPRESLFAFLLIPPLVRMLAKGLNSFKGLSNPSSDGSPASNNALCKEEVPAILGMLVLNNLETQKAAADAGVIKRLSQLLKESFDPLPMAPPSSLWTPEVSSSELTQNRDESSRLGDPGVSYATYHILRLRESVLAALAAIASDKDEYRKEIIENGVIPFVIKTLKAEPIGFATTTVKHSAPRDSKPEQDIQWDYRDVVLAACGVARALSRSVATLRTSLMDAGLAAPLFALLKNNDVEIQVAATAVVCNLVLRFSAMREAIMDGGILVILCNHAHSMNAKLRLNSMWALKHIVAGASNHDKMTCLEQLDLGWLKQILSNEIEPSSPMPVVRGGSREDGTITPIRMNTPNAAGEQVDLLNAVVEASREPNDDMEDDGDEDLKMSDSIGALGGKEELDARSFLRQVHSKNESIEGGLFESPRHQYNRNISDEVAIQKEGLEILRNLTCGDHSSEMIDHLFREMGQDKVFEMLISKLRPKIINAFSRDRRSAENAPRQAQPKTELVVSTCFIIVHIAAGQPKHRQLLVAQTELLKLLVPLFNHTCRDIRSCCAWFVYNVTWVQDASDRLNAKARARELAKLGYLEKLEAMDKDESLDCRERGKTARDQMRQLLQSA